MSSNRRDEHISLLLHAPLGILLLIRCIEECDGNPFRAYTAEHFSELVIEETGDFHFNTLSAERLSELIVECVTDLSRFAPDYQQRVRALLTRGPSLRHAAEQLLNVPGTVSWFADLDRREQIWLSPDGRPPTPIDFKPDLRPFRQEVPKPRRALWTSTSIGTYPSHWMPHLRWGEDRRSPPYYPWRLNVSPTARIYEVHVSEAWRTLCLEFPLYAPDGAIMPNWETVAHVWDGVHLSVGGLLTTEGVPGNTNQGWVQLTDWNVESTAWFRWIFDQVERLPDADW